MNDHATYRLAGEFKRTVTTLLGKVLQGKIASVYSRLIFSPIFVFGKLMQISQLNSKILEILGKYSKFLL